MSRNKKNNSSVKFLVISIAILLIVIVGTSIFKNANKNSSGNNKKPLVKDADLVIQTGEISTKAKFYPVEIEGTMLEVLAVKAPDGSIKTAFNTCQVCFSSGRGYYVQEGNALVCQNCGNSFGMNDVEVTRGGCNPVPITSSEKTVTDSTITISKDYLKQAKVIFSNWKN